jgi:hypothetical protein
MVNRAGSAMLMTGSLSRQTPVNLIALATVPNAQVQTFALRDFVVATLAELGPTPAGLPPNMPLN